MNGLGPALCRLRPQLDRHRAQLAPAMVASITLSPMVMRAPPTTGRGSRTVASTRLPELAGERGGELVQESALGQAAARLDHGLATPSAASFSVSNSAWMNGSTVMRSPSTSSDEVAALGVEAVAADRQDQRLLRAGIEPRIVEGVRDAPVGDDRARELQHSDQTGSVFCSRASERHFGVGTGDGGEFGHDDDFSVAVTAGA